MDTSRIPINPRQGLKSGKGTPSEGSSSLEEPRRGPGKPCHVEASIRIEAHEAYVGCDSLAGWLRWQQLAGTEFSATEISFVIKPWSWAGRFREDARNALAVKVHELIGWTR